MIDLESFKGQKEIANPFLLVQSTPMFVEGTTNIGVSGSPKKVRRKRKGEANESGKEKKDKKLSNDFDKVDKKSKKDKSAPHIFPNFWAAAPCFPAITDTVQQPSKVNQEPNLLEDLAIILERHKIVGQPAVEINKLIQSAIGQICALRSSVHNMESRLSKLEENQVIKVRSYAETAKVQNQTVKENKESDVNPDPNTHKHTFPVKESNNSSAKTTAKKSAAKAVAKSKHTEKPAKKQPRQPEKLKPKPNVPTLIVKPTTEGSTYKDLKSTLLPKLT
ncbi:hypothetical protein AVEN_125373-1 [Araneus ventricosus]|uniref:Uncharacterized protein n=1 Tax=Araneus ventricosus TaxID=182803 RepID=A0A4Y2TAE3_ARAVE|nr:hypothetical protein AVEN_125373-1 [Araneus ventricosus]